MSSNPTMKALVADGKGGASIQTVESYPVRDDYVKIKVHAMALNPTDMKHVFHYTKGGEVVGIDTSGSVIAIGKDVKTKVAIGDRISSFSHGCNSYSPRDGAFAETAEVKDGLFTHLPESWSYEMGATLGGGVITAGQGLFQSTGLPTPDKPATSKIPVVIYGGSTATGCLAIQFAKLANLEIITLASPRQFDRLKKLGATHVYDYHTPDVGKKINQDFNNSIFYAFDIISSPETMQICADALSSGPSPDGKKPHCTILLPDRHFPREDVECVQTSGYACIGETAIKYGKVVHEKPENYAWGVYWWSLIQDLIFAGKLIPHEMQIRSGGLEAVMPGLKDLEEGKVKGAKIVIPWEEKQ